jgi:hypothetical protein
MISKHMPPSLLTIAVVAAISSTQSQAFTFDAFEGELTGKFDTTLVLERVSALRRRIRTSTPMPMAYSAVKIAVEGFHPTPIMAA